MKLKNILTFTLILMMSVALVACGGEKAAPTPEPTTAPTQEPTGTVDPLNGSMPANEYKPVAVVISNIAGARPQKGLQAADIVYECEVEGGISRFLAIFNSEKPTEVGPIRSARIYFIKFATEYDALFAHHGAATGDKIFDAYYYLKNNAKLQNNVDGMSLTGSLFYRSSDRRAPHNSYFYLQKAMNEKYYNFTPKKRELPFDKEYVPKDGEAKDIQLPWQASYQYDEANGVYKRNTAGKAHIDVLTNKQVTVKNIVIMKAPFTAYKGSNLFSLNNTSGECVVIRDGKQTKGMWSKGASDSDPTLFKDSSGKEIPFAPGNTWIHVMPTEKSFTVK